MARPGLIGIASANIAAFVGGGRQSNIAVKIAAVITQILLDMREITVVDEYPSTFHCPSSTAPYTHHRNETSLAASNKQDSFNSESVGFSLGATTIALEFIENVFTLGLLRDLAFTPLNSRFRPAGATFLARFSYLLANFLPLLPRAIYLIATSYETLRKAKTLISQSALSNAPHLLFGFLFSFFLAPTHMDNHGNRFGAFEYFCLGGYQTILSLAIGCGANPLKQKNVTKA